MRSSRPSAFRRLSLPALWAAALGASCADEPPPGPPPNPLFRKVELDAAPGEPMGLAVLPDGRVLHTTRDGELWLHDGTDKTRLARFDVYTHDEEGLQGIAIDPAWPAQPWIYIYYSPALATPVDDPATSGVEGEAALMGEAGALEIFAGQLRLSRVRFDGGSIDLASEQVILEVPADRGLCCHLAGQLDFDAEGNLYLSTGDDTYPFASGGYAPIDERPDRHPGLDAQRTSANTNDLRGKLLRIRVQADGTYTIPDGNLFAPGSEGARPEIYAMGLRNPFRFSVQRESGDVHLADYAPDAPVADPARGPGATAKWVRITEAGNYGWPYCADAEHPYVDFDFATSTSTTPFDCAAPRNESPRNTGVTELPPVRPAELTYSYEASARFPELGAGGVAPMAGPSYAFDEGSPSAVKWPKRLSGVPLFYEWARDRLLAFHLDAKGAIERIETLSTDWSLDNPIDMEFGPDGALYVLEYGDGQRTANSDARLSRIEYVGPAE